MRAIITNFGTRGDFEPFISLATQLAMDGHEAVIAAPRFAEATVRQSGTSYLPIGEGLPEIRDRINLLWTTSANAYSSSTELLKELNPLREQFPLILEELVNACSGGDVLISGPAQPLARVVHDTTGIPFVTVQISNFGGNGGPALSEAGDALVNSFRSQIGLTPIKHAFTLGANSPQLALYAVSRHLRQRPSTWPLHYQMTGFFFNPVIPDPEPALVDFLANGSPPVMITFGSMPHERPDDLRVLVLEAIARCGRRAVIQGIERPANWEMNNNVIFWAEYVSHLWLFPKSACVVTHGGAGTAAAIFRAGVPGVFIPHGEIYDQRYWGQLAHELGSAPEPIPFQELDFRKLSDAMSRALEDEKIVEKASQLAAKIRSERGVQNASLLVRTLVERVGLMPSAD
jgi:UDP:flavonoid glycosyltransferase YjiC (YdhE family)